MLLYDWSSRRSIALINQESWERGELQSLEPPLRLWQIYPSWEYRKKITSRREDLILGSPSHPPVNDFRGSPDNLWVKASSMLAVTQPCGVLCVPPLTPIHLAEMVCTALVPNFNSHTSLLAKSLLVLRAKLPLKPKHIPECLYSLKQHLLNLFYPSLALFTHTLSLHDREHLCWIWWLAMCVCSEARSGAYILICKRSGLQNCVSGTFCTSKDVQGLGICTSGGNIFIFLVSVK